MPLADLPTDAVLDRQPSGPPALVDLPENARLDAPKRAAGPDLTDADVWTLAGGGMTPEMMKGMTPGNSVFGGIVRGGRDVVDAGAQLLTRSIETGAKYLAPDSKAAKWATGQRANVENINKGAEQDYEQNWRGGMTSPDAGRMIGGIAATAPIAAAMPALAAASLPVRALMGAGSGGLTASLQPVDANNEGDFWKQKATQLLHGMAIGGGAPVATAAAGRIVSPQTSDAVRLLMRNGITPTPGQILGPTANRVEEAAQSIPLVGDAIKAARGRTIEQFNRASINKSLEPIGEKLAVDTAMGHDAIEEAANKISAAYDTLLPKLTVKADPRFAFDMAALRGLAKNMPAERAQQFENILQDKVASKFSAGGGMTGESFKEVESELGRLARQYRNTADADQRQLGDALFQTQSNLRGLLSRSNPDHAETLGSINKAYANLLRVQGAAGRIGAEEGQFTPAQLLSSVRQLDPSLRKSAFAKGNAPMQEFAEAGKSVLGNKVPDSGTALRNALWQGPAALGGLSLIHPGAALGAGAAGATTAAAYSPWGQSALAAILARRPDAAGQIAAGMQKASPLLSTALPLALAP